MTKYYLVITEIEPDFTNNTIVAASTAAQALDTVQQLAALFGYHVREAPRQLDRAEAAQMAAAAGARIIKATKEPRISIAKQEKGNAQETKREPLKPEHVAEIMTELDRLDIEAKQRFINFISFLRALEEQPTAKI